MERLERTLQLHFAALTAIGGLMMVSGEVGTALPTIAVVAAIAAFLLVDLWKIFHLPTSAAYLGMGVVAIYCMAEFLWVRTNAQLQVVAQLLVLVEAVLLFQRKTIRVFEQIGVFCLLELVVAAVFNSALLFGFLLIPFALIGLRGLVLLQSLSTARASAAKAERGIRTSASESIRDVASCGVGLPRAGIAVLAPAVLLLAATFFYVLPRATGDSGTTPVGGRATTGFSQSMTLDQVGELLQNSDLVMRLTMINQRTGGTYRVREPIYLRGQVLERYAYQHGTARWLSLQLPLTPAGNPLPAAHDSPEGSRESLYDRVEFRVDLQPVTGKSLFAVAPYHSLRSNAQVEHLVGQWLIARHDRHDYWQPARFSYRFGTHAFHDGRQTPFLRYFGPDEESRHVFRGRRLPRRAAWPHLDTEVYRQMLQFDPLHMPTVAFEASGIASSIGDRRNSAYWLSQAIEEHLSTTGGFEYTLDLSAQRDRSTDPVEQFVARDRRGHCQYFASAMVMMLRSQNIPARVVVGYKTDEYNPLGKHYLVRQLHAHAWVEALIEEDEIPSEMRPHGQHPSGPFLVRFDPTPGGTGVNAEVGGVDKFYDFAQSLWSHYVLDMNGDRQRETLFGRQGNDEMVSAYADTLTQLRQTISHIDVRQMEAGVLAKHHLFSWRSAALGVTGMLILSALYRIALPRRLRLLWPGRRPQASVPHASSVVFYQRLCDLLAKAELHREAGQTPQEFADQATTRLVDPHPGTEIAENPRPARRAPLRTLVEIFYRVRYGGAASLDAGDSETVERSLEQIEGMVHRAIRCDARSETS